MQGGVDTSHMHLARLRRPGPQHPRRPELHRKGFGVRPALGCSDRGHSAASQIRPGEVNWEKLFGEEGVRWFHTGGIFAALASNTAEAVIEAVEVAAQVRHHCLLRPELPRPRSGSAQGGKEGAQKINRHIAQYVDVMIGNEEDFTACLGFEVEGLDEHISGHRPGQLQEDDRDRREAVPQLQGRRPPPCATPRPRRVNDWSAILYAGGEFYQSMMRENLEIYDRVGGGDGFASAWPSASWRARAPRPPSNTARLMAPWP